MVKAEDYPPRTRVAAVEQVKAIPAACEYQRIAPIHTIGRHPQRKLDRPMRRPEVDLTNRFPCWNMHDAPDASRKFRSDAATSPLHPADLNLDRRRLVASDHAGQHLFAVYPGPQTPACGRPFLLRPIRKHRMRERWQERTAFKIHPQLAIRRNCEFPSAKEAQPGMEESQPRPVSGQIVDLQPIACIARNAHVHERFAETDTADGKFEFDAQTARRFIPPSLPPMGRQVREPGDR